MTTVLCVGDDLPSEVVSALHIGCTVERCSAVTADQELTGIDYAFVAAGTDAPRQLGLLDAQSVAYALWVPKVDLEVLNTVVLAHPVESVLEGAHPPPDVVRVAIGRMTQVVEGRRHRAGLADLPLGQHFALDLAADRERSYRAGAALAMVSASTQELMRDLRATIAAMNQTVLPELRWEPGRVPVPAGRAAAGRGTAPGGGRPRLAELFAKDRKALLGVNAADERRAAYPPPGAALIRGESGSGKSLIAELMHSQFQASTQWTTNNTDHGDKIPKIRPMPLVKINCGGMTTHNFDHDLIGSAGRYYSGVDEPAVGLLPQADYGVAFLDEIGDLDQGAQSRLKTFLDDRVINPMGVGPYYLHTRVIAATNVDLESSGFQHDLRQRFTFTLTVPPLNERREEIPRLVDYAAQNPAVNPLRGDGLSVTHVDSAALSLLKRHDWSHGNFRELRQIVERAVFHAVQDRRSVIVAVDVERARFDKPLPAGLRRIVNLAEDLPADLAAGATAVASADDLVRVSLVHESPILQGPSGPRWVRTSAGTYVYDVDQDGSR